MTISAGLSSPVDDHLFRTLPRHREASCFPAMARADYLGVHLLALRAA